MRLRVNEFEIEYDKNARYFWLREGDYISLSINLNQIKDLKEVISRFEEKLKEQEKEWKN